jgi:adenosyl cobinamide kinase/adenosyl cobinamide phosphate guanylyltransferase
MVVIGILGKNDVGKSLFCTLGLKDKITNALYFVTDGAELSCSLQPHQDKIPNVQFMNSLNDLGKLATSIKASKEKIIIIDHLGSLVNRCLAESNLDENNPNFNFQLGALVRKKVALPLLECIHNARQYKKNLVIVCPLDHNSTDDLVKSSVAFDTKTAQDVFFNECDVIVHLKRKTYKPVKTLEELFEDMTYVFHYNHETQVILKDKPNAKFNKKLDNQGTLLNLLSQIFAKE